MLKESMEDSDVEDEVFVRDRKVNYKMSSKDVGKESPKKPLMPPKRKTDKKLKPSILLHPLNPGEKIDNTTVRRSIRIYNCLLPTCVAGSALLCIFALFGMYSLLQAMGFFQYPMDMTNQVKYSMLRNCNALQTTSAWNLPIGYFSPVTSNIEQIEDSPGNMDFIIGFGRGPSPHKQHPWYKEETCTRKEEEVGPCRGYLVRIDGKNGNKKWEQWLSDEVYQLNCKSDFSGDGQKDCILTGSNGLFLIVNGLNGVKLWSYNTKVTKFFTMNIYQPTVINDVNGDYTPDILVMHSIGNTTKRSIGRMIIVSGKNGRDIRKITLSKYGENLGYFMQPAYMLSPAEDRMTSLFVSGSTDVAGSLFVVTLGGAMGGHFSANIKELYHDPNGITAPPVVEDLTSDGVQDVILVASDRVILFDGAKRYSTVWNISLYDAVPTKYWISAVSGYAAHFNEDTVKDVVVVLHVGYDFPSYHYSAIVVLDGKTGKPVANKTVTRTRILEVTGMVDASDVQVLMYWALSCENHEDAKDPFIFKPLHKTNEAQLQSEVDLCKVRFNAKSKLQLYGYNKYSEVPGSLVHLIIPVDSKLNANGGSSSEGKKNSAIGSDDKGAEGDSKTIIVEGDDAEMDNNDENEDIHYDDNASRNEEMNVDYPLNEDIGEEKVKTRSETGMSGSHSALTSHDLDAALKSILSSGNIKPPIDQEVYADDEELENEMQGYFVPNGGSHKGEHKSTPEPYLDDEPGDLMVPDVVSHNLREDQSGDAKYDGKPSTLYKDRNKKTREVVDEIDKPLQSTELDLMHTITLSDEQIVSIFKKYLLRGMPTSPPTARYDVLLKNYMTLSTDLEIATDTLLLLHKDDKDMFRKVVVKQRRLLKEALRQILAYERDKNEYYYSDKTNTDGNVYTGKPEEQARHWEEEFFRKLKEMMGERRLKRETKENVQTVHGMPTILSSTYLDGLQKGGLDFVYVEHSAEPAGEGVQILKGKAEECIQTVMSHGKGNVSLKVAKKHAMRRCLRSEAKHLKEDHDHNHHYGDVFPYPSKTLGMITVNRYMILCNNEKHPQ